MESHSRSNHFITYPVTSVDCDEGHVSTATTDVENFVDIFYVYTLSGPPHTRIALTISIPSFQIVQMFVDRIKGSLAKRMSVSSNNGLPMPPCKNLSMFY